MRFLTWVTIHD